jgi:hypothetical protein
MLVHMILNSTSNSPATAVSAVGLNPLRKAAEARIKVLDLPGGGKEFVLPALRNLRVKLMFSLIWLVMTASLAFGTSVFVTFVGELPLWIRWFFVDHGLFALGILGLVVLVLTLACLDMWLRSTRVIAKAGELQVVTRWLLFERACRISASNIIETKVENTTTAGTTRYYDIIVLAVGDKPGWLARSFPARVKPGSSFTERDVAAFNTGGKRLSAATGIEGEDEATWLLGQLRGGLGIGV